MAKIDRGDRAPVRQRSVVEDEPRDRGAELSAGVLVELGVNARPGRIDPSRRPSYYTAS